MALPQLPKLKTWVRFPSPAPFWLQSRYNQSLLIDSLNMSLLNINLKADSPGLGQTPEKLTETAICLLVE